ncbi:MAG: class I SAM-dependent methyltransferase [Verrucomicrobia bacterium]|nr:class I SAM-dependent methyltransferase [Verrucomicrobiota bacterium]
MLLRIKRSLGKLLPQIWMSPQSTYNAEPIVEEYASDTKLQKPEQTILSLVTETIKTGRMLDIGVGAGRTTHHFAPLAREYIGIDYADNMLRTCYRRFHPLPSNISFIHCDARDLSIFGDAYFDFVLASYNCFDGLSHSDRIKIFKEIKRTCKIGALVSFSSHNLLFINNYFKINWWLERANLESTKSLNFLYRIYCYGWVLALNDSREHLSDNDYVMMHDGTHNFSHKLYYITPRKQVEQLAELGFNNTRIFSLDGNEIESGGELSRARDCWLYYLCTTG